MISFRYHVVTIVAVFLALGLGVLAGTTVIDQSLVQNLEDRKTQLVNALDETRTDLGELRSFLTLAVPHLVEGRLSGQEVVLVTDEHADGGALSSARGYLQDAGADIVAELQVTAAFAVDGETSRSSLQEILGLEDAPDEDLPAVAARALGDRLVFGALQQEPRLGRPVRPALLRDLLEEGYLLPGADALPGDLGEIGGPGQAIVVVDGGEGELSMPPSSFMVPFVERLVHDGADVVAAEPTLSRHDFVEVLRDTLEDQELVTVDDLNGDDFVGGVALVLGLRELLSAEHRGGHFGTKAGASGLLPEV